MKRIPFLLLCIMLIMPSLISWASQRVTRKPDFFMPAGVWENRHTKVKIPPITAMRFRSETPPIVLEMRRQNSEAAQKRAEEKLKALQEQTSAQVTNANKITEIAKTPKETETATNLPIKIDTNPVMLPPAPIKENHINAETADNYVIEAATSNNNTTEAQPVMLPKTPLPTAEKIATEQQPLSTVQQINLPKDHIAGFDQIFAEYQQDINAIGQGKEVNNLRLENVLSQWNGKEKSM